MTDRRLLPSTRLAIQVAVSTLVAVLFVDVVDVERPYWIVLTAIVVMVGTVGETMAKSIDRTIGTVLGIAIGIAVYWGTVKLGIPGVVLLFLAGPSIVFFKFASYRLMILALTMMLAFLFLAGGATDAILFARIIDTIIGAVIATIVSFAVLPIPTRQPAIETIDSYVADMKATVHECLEAVAADKWSYTVEARSAALRETEATLEQLATSLRAESALFGGSGALAHGALALIPVMRGHIESILEASQPAAESGLGPLIAAQLTEISLLVCANLDRFRDALVTGSNETIPRLDAPTKAIEEALKPRLIEASTEKRAVMTVLNLILALRRLNRGLRHAVERSDLR